MGKAKLKKRRGPTPVHKSRRASVKDAQGKVHLRVHTDPSTGAKQVALAAPLFEEQWQNRVATSAAATALQMLDEEVTEERVAQLARHGMDAVSKLADGMLAQAEEGAVACKAGCDHCCYQSVGVTPAEALTIVAHLREQLDAKELEAFTARLGGERERTRGLNAKQRFSVEYPCPFLKAGQCTIYEVRPLSCRGMNSLDAAECERDLRDPAARARFVEAGTGGHSFLEPIRAFHAVSAGLQLALGELFNLDMRPLDLTAAVHELLAKAELAVEPWLQGRRSLEAARGGDSTENENIRSLSGSDLSKL